MKEMEKQKKEFVGLCFSLQRETLLIGLGLGP